MSQLFKTYEEEFIASSASINKKITSIPVQSHQKKQMAFVDIKEDLDECEKILKRMETQSNSLDIQIKFQYTRKVRQYKKDFSEMKKKLYKAEEDYAFEKNKEMLMGAQLDEEKSTHRDKLIEQGEMLSDTNYKLRNSVRVMHETEQIHNNIEVELTGQSEKMRKNKERLIDMRDDIGSSEKRIKSMMLRVRKNKMVVFGVLGLLVLIITIILIVHFV